MESIEKIVIEACVGSLQQSINAQQCGAGRLELCDLEDPDGTTPSEAMMRAVKEAVNKDLADALLAGHVEQSKEMADVAVNSAVGKQSEEMQCGGVMFYVIHGVEQRLILKKAAVLDRVGDQGQVLIYDAAGADVEMADL